MVKNVLRVSDIVNLLYLCYTFVWLCYAYFTLMLWIFFLAYIWVYKSYDSDDLPLTQMAVQKNTRVNTEDEDAEHEENDENYEWMSNKGAN